MLSSPTNQRVHPHTYCSWTVFIGSGGFLEPCSLERAHRLQAPQNMVVFTPLAPGTAEEVCQESAGVDY